jgi:hypothetical protein
MREFNPPDHRYNEEDKIYNNFIGENKQQYICPSSEQSNPYTCCLLPGIVPLMLYTDYSYELV